MFCRKDVIRKFAKFTAKQMCQRPATLLKKRLWYRCFPVNFAKFLRTPFFTEHFRWLLLHFLVTRNNLHYYLETMLMLLRLMMMSCFVVYQLTNEVTVNLFLTGTTVGNSCHRNSQHIVSYVWAWIEPIIIFIIFWDFLMFYQIFLLPKVKRCAIITYQHGI